MNYERSSQKRKTIRIKLYPKPAAPRHSAIVARAIALPQPPPATQRDNDSLIFSAMQQIIVIFFAATVLDMGELFQIVAYAALAYWTGFFLIARRKEKMTHLDDLLIRWGFLALCVLSFFLSQLIWVLRGYGM